MKTTSPFHPGKFLEIERLEATAISSCEKRSNGEMQRKRKSEFTEITGNARKINILRALLYQLPETLTLPRQDKDDVS